MRLFQQIVTVRQKLAGVSKDIILMEEVLGFMYESLTSRKVMPEPVEQNGRALYDRLQIGDLSAQLLARVKDLKKNMEGTRHEFDVSVMVHKPLRHCPCAQSPEFVS